MRYIWDWKSHFNNEDPKDIFDCFIAEYLLSDGRAIPEEEKTLEKYKVTSLDALGMKQQELFKELPQLYSLFSTIEVPLIPVLLSMEKNGITLDTAWSTHF